MPFQTPHYCITENTSRCYSGTIHKYLYETLLSDLYLFSCLVVKPIFSPPASSSRTGSSLCRQLRRQRWRWDSVWQPPWRQRVLIWIRWRQHEHIRGYRGWRWAWTKPLQHIHIDREGAQLLLALLYGWRAADGHGGGEESTDQLQNQRQLHHWDL